MIRNQEFANLQVFCDKERRVAKKVYEFLYKGFKNEGIYRAANRACTGNGYFMLLGWFDLYAN